MSCFSVGPVEILGQKKWVVKWGSIQVGGPFDTEGPAEALRQDMESAYAEIRQEIRHETTMQDATVFDKFSADGTYIGKPVCMNRHFAIIDTKRSTGVLLSMAPLDDANIKLTIGKLIHLSYKNGLAKLHERKAEHEAGLSR